MKEGLMNHDDPSVALYEKMRAELEKYRAHLMTLTPAEILNHTYEYTIKQDIVECAENDVFDDYVVRTLLRSPCPLEDVFKEYNTRDTQHMDILRDCFEAEAKAAIKRERDKPKKKDRGIER